MSHFWYFDTSQTLKMFSFHQTKLQTFCEHN